MAGAISLALHKLTISYMVAETGESKPSSGVPRPTMEVADVPVDVCRGGLAEVSRAVVAPRSILVGLIGKGIQFSRAPALHEHEGAAQGLTYVYRLIDIEALGLDLEALPELIAAARRFAFTGINVTHPCKQAIIPLLDELSPEARVLGAVNTVVFEPGGHSVGHNTDWSGFAESFERELAGVLRRRVVLLGAGGAGAAVSHALLRLGVGELAIIDTDAARAKRLAADLCGRFGAGRAIASRDPTQGINAADGIVNTTPVGMTSHPGTPIACELLRPDLWVADIVYFPLETELLRAAGALGCRTMGGGGMAVLQAADAFRLFTGREPDAERMIKHFDSMG
jgi:shikimate dehydrogenase